VKEEKPISCAEERGQKLTERALTAPGYYPEWHIGVRAQKSGKLVAFISGIKVDIRVREK
jgi:glycylpeptide N-tetradecanoyltransferase